MNFWEFVTAEVILEDLLYVVFYDSWEYTYCKVEVREDCILNKVLISLLSLHLHFLMFLKH